MRKVNPLNDLVFKKVMGEEGNEFQLKSFLEATLSREFKSVTIQGAMELTPDIIGNKLSRLDVLAKADDDTEINIEVQLKDHKNMGKRTIFYWGRRFGNALKSGKENDYTSLPDMITINLLGFNYIEDEPEEEFHNVYYVKNARSGNILDRCLEIHFIEMPKFLKLKTKDVANNKMHRWLAFFDSDLSEQTLKELIEMDAAIKQAQKKIEYISHDAESYHQVILREQALLDYTSDINFAKRETEKKMVDAMKLSGMSDEQIQNILELAKK